MLEVRTSATFEGRGGAAFWFAHEMEGNSMVDDADEAGGMHS